MDTANHACHDPVIPFEFHLTCSTLRPHLLNPQASIAQPSGLTCSTPTPSLDLVSLTVLSARKYLATYDYEDKHNVRHIMFRAVLSFVFVY